MLELCSGTAVLSAAFRDLGWETITVDVDPCHKPDHCTSVFALDREWVASREPFYVHSAPPCTEFSKHAMPWHSDANPSTELAEHCWSISQAAPLYSLENVKGAINFLSPLFGNYITSCGGHSVFIWGNVEGLDLSSYRTNKQHVKTRGKARSIERGSYPREVCQAIATYVDTVYSEFEKIRRSSVR